MTIKDIAKEEVETHVCKNCKVRTNDCFEHCFSIQDWIVGYMFGYKRGQVNQQILTDIKNGDYE